MPWTARDAYRKTHKASSPVAQRQWSHVADAILAKTGNEGQAIREANGVVARRGMKPAKPKSRLASV